MAFWNKKTEGGHAKGHSSMDHWEKTEVIKKATRKGRRQEDKKLARIAQRTEPLFPKQ